MNFGEKLRRTINSLDSHTELRNLIGEEEDVAKAYENIVKQGNDKCHYLNKWGNKEGDFKSLFSIIIDHNPAHNVIITDFAKQYRIYIVGLKEILLKTEKLHSEEKHLKELEEKVAKRKASESQLNEAKNHRDVLATELQRMKESTLKESFVNLTKAYCEMYSQGLAHMNKQLAAFGATPSFSSQPSANAHSAVSPQQNYVGHQQQPERRASNPPPVYDQYSQHAQPQQNYGGYQQPVEQYAQPPPQNYGGYQQQQPQAPPRRVSNPPAPVNDFNNQNFGYQQQDQIPKAQPQLPTRRTSNPPAPSVSNPFSDQEPFEQNTANSLPQPPRKLSNPPANSSSNIAPQMPPRKLSNTGPQPYSYGFPPAQPTNPNAIKPASH